MTQALIQSTFGQPGNFELLVLKNSHPAEKLKHYFRDNNPAGTKQWHPSLDQTISSNEIINSHATSPGAIIQSTFGNPGNFDILVLEGTYLNHYFRDNSNPSSEWRKTATVCTTATGPAGFIQSTIGNSRNFDAVVLEGCNLVHYFRDNSSPDYPWHRTAVITSKTTGPGSIIQSTYGTPSHPGDFEVVVPEGNHLVHYTRDNSSPSSPWLRREIITSSASGPASLIQSTYHGTPGHPVPSAPGNFELVVREGSNLMHYFRDNSTPKTPWSKTAAITTTATGDATIIQSSYGTPQVVGDFEVVVSEGRDLVHYWRDNGSTGLPWIKTVVISDNAAD